VGRTGEINLVPLPGTKPRFLGPLDRGLVTLLTELQYCSNLEFIFLCVFALNGSQYSK
jgi:hypothetical protein